MRRITALEARHITRRGLHRADPTLYLCVAKGGTKSWIQRLLVNGKRRDIGLGSFPAVSLAAARTLAMQNRARLMMGGDPVAEREAARAERKRRAVVPTFEAMNDIVLAAKAPTWRSAITEKNWRGSMAHYVLPRIGHKPIDRIGRRDILAILTPIWTEKPEQARKLRQRLVAVFDHATASGLIDSNPAGETISSALPRKRPARVHFRALPYKSLPEALRALRGSLTSTAALRFLVHTAARSGEVRGACWNEIDGGVWKIPGERTKNGREHRVPLTGAALDVLDKARVLDDGSGLIFPSPTRAGRPMSDMTLTKVLRANGIADRATVHGFRSTFRAWCADTGKPRDLAEAALAHVVAGVDGASFRSDLFQRRRRLMEQWSDYLTGEKSSFDAPDGRQDPQ